eukprot:10899-Heterococcus_DN1.PRE.2
MGLETVSPALQGLQSPDKQARWAKSRRLLFEHSPNDNEPAYQARRDANVLGLPLVRQKASARALTHTAPSVAASATVRDLQRQAFEQSLLEGELLNERLRRQPGGPQAQARIERKQTDLELQLLLDCPAYSSRDLPYTSSTHEYNERDARLTAVLQRSAQVERCRTAQRELVSASDAASQTLLRSEASDAAEACAIADLAQLRHSGSSFDAVALRRQDWLREKANAQEHKLQFRDAITGLASLKQRWAPELAPLFDATPTTLSAVAVSNATATAAAVAGTSMWVLGTVMVGEAAETVGTVLYFVQSDAPEPPQNGWRKFAAGLADSTTTAVSAEAELTVTPLQPRPVIRCDASASTSNSSSSTTACAAVTAVKQQQQQLRGWTVAGAADPDLNGRYMLDTVRGTALDGAPCYCSALNSSVLLYRHTVPAAQGLDTALAGCSLYDPVTAEAAALRTAAGAAAQFSALAGSSMHAARMQVRTDTTTAAAAADAAATTAGEHSSAVTTQLDTVPVQHVQRLTLLHSQNGAPLLCGVWASMGVCSNGQLCSGRHHFTSESERAAVTSARTAGAAVAEVAVLGCIAKREALLDAVTGAYFNVFGTSKRSVQYIAACLCTVVYLYIHAHYSVCAHTTTYMLCCMQPAFKRVSSLRAA